MTFTTAEILEDFQEKTLGVPAGNSGVVTQDICKRDTKWLAKFTQREIKTVIEGSPVKESVTVSTREIEKVFGR